MYLPDMAEEQIRLGINTIIADNRKNMPQYSSTSAFTKNSKRIFHDELREFVRIYGVARGYVKPDNY